MIEHPRSYVELVEEVYSRIVPPLKSSPATLLDAWSNFVSQCEEGYEFPLDEYDYDLNVRDKIEKILAAPELQGFDELTRYRMRVDAVDARFRDLLTPIPRERALSPAWWRQGVLKAASEPYAEDAMNRYETAIRII